MKPKGVAVAALAAAVVLPSLANGLVYDDVLLILQNPLVHHLSRAGEIWGSSYWPAGGLYRPLTVQLFALEWAIGGGRPITFHLVSLLLAVAATLLVLRLALRVLPAFAAVAAAALFAVHPVHVEAVTNAVGQSELLVALCALWAVERYLTWRAEGDLTPARRLGLAALTLLGILAKETGYMIPILLAGAELVVVRARRERVAATFLLQAAALAAGLLLRLIVLGSVAGEQPTAVFRNLSAGARAVAMLAVVPQWLRLLLWPAHLQAEYGPPALPVDSSPGPAHLLGIVVLLLALGLFLRARRRNPPLAFGLLWTAVALVPVSNLFAATGIVLAERVLFLPSVGVALALGAAIAAVSPRLETAPRLLRRAAAGLALAILGAAMVRTVEREAVGKSQERFFAQLVVDAPGTYRAWFVAARFDYGERRFPEAERAARRALALYSGDPQVHEQLGQVLRVEGRCDLAVPILSAGIVLDPGRTTLRSRLIECALAVGDTARARAVAAEAVRLGQSEFRATLERLSP